MKSIWQIQNEKPKFDPLNGDIKTDVLIVGGGLTGILCGYMLKKAGVDCIIAEAETVCGGITKDTTAKVTLHHGAIFDKMINRYGVEKARLYVKAHSEAIDKYAELAKSLPCNFEAADSFVYSVRDRGKIEKEVRALEKLNCRANFTTKTELPFTVSGAVKVPDQARFDPLKFAYALARDLKIYESTAVTKICHGYAETSRGKIKAKKIIVATHFPFINTHGLFFLKMYQHRSYVLALENAPEINGMYVDECEKGMSFRKYENYLLLGGGGHRTGKNGGGYSELKKFASDHYPHATELCRYATQDCITLDDIPYVGQYSPNTPSLYVATGFNKWGMTSAMLSACLLTDLITGKDSEYSELFSPSRSIWHKQLFINSGESLIGLLRPTAPRCSHLGCALKYNKQEHSWDCPCHGSRYTDIGKVIDNPAVKDIAT